MRNTLALALLVALLWGTVARAAEEFTVLYAVNMPACCEMDAVMVDIVCDYCCTAYDNLKIEFLDRSMEVVATAEIGPDWCNACMPLTAPLDTTVNSASVCYVRLTKDADDCDNFWMSLWVRCGTYDCCGKWCRVFKDCVWCWELIPEPKPEIATPAPPPAPPAPPVEKPAPPEEKPDFGYFPPEEPKEVVTVEGRG